MMTGIKKRIVSGLILGILFLSGAFWIPSIGICAVMVTMAVLALLEFYRLLDLAGIPSFRILGAVSGATLIIGTWLVYALKAPAWATDLESAILFGSLVAVCLRQFPQKFNDQPLATMACTLFGILYVPFLFNYFTKLAYAWGPAGLLGRVSPTGCWLVFYLIAVVKMTDTGAFLIGSWLGRHKLIPRISPGKTWEGCLGGIAAGLLLSLLLAYLWHGRFGILHMGLRDAVILGLLLPILGTIGDLTESMLKRAANTKDSSTVVPGMGGILDVLDSLLFAVPALYFYARFFMTPGP